MITFNGHGLCISDVGCGGASIDSKGIRVRFEDGSSVWLSKALIEHAQTLIDYHDKKRPKRATVPSSEEQD